jgi:hypothetical protein
LLVTGKEGKTGADAQLNDIFTEVEWHLHDKPERG